jgi:hypothetical protein
MDVVGDLINLIIAAFTAWAARSASVSASASVIATEQSTKEAEASRKIAQQQTDALMTAAKANALASRISFYSEQIRFIEKQFEARQNRGSEVEPGAGGKLKELKDEQAHLAHWLDRQMDSLEVGLHFKCGLPFDSRVEEWKKKADQLKQAGGIAQ